MNASASLFLLQGFHLRFGQRSVSLPLSAQRVLAFLALHERPLQRVFVAGSLWIDSDEQRANASLRTALWRLRNPACPLVDVTPTQVGLASDVTVDLREAEAGAKRALCHAPRSTDLASLCVAGDLLPDWYDDWVLIERERFRQLRLHALESLCDELTAEGRFADATEAGLAAVAAEPLRESAHRALVRTHLAQGNYSEAIRQFRLFETMLRDQLGLEPSAQMTGLLEALAIL
jgi:DNA-binding SARP family transcriptional activator